MDRCQIHAAIKRFFLDMSHAVRQRHARQIGTAFGKAHGNRRRLQLEGDAFDRSVPGHHRFFAGPLAEQSGDGPAVDLRRYDHVLTAAGVTVQQGGC